MCEHLNKWSPLNSKYKIDNTVINKVTSAKYLGVTIAQNLLWKEHITRITNKANSTRGFFNTTYDSVKSLAYTTYIQPILKYAPVVWSPHIQTHKNLLEMVQRKAARFVLNSYARNTSVAVLLEQLDWTTLQDRRK